MKLSELLITASAAAALCTGVHAQRGPLGATDLALSVRPVAELPQQPERVYIKAPGDQTTPPFEPTPTGFSHHRNQLLPALTHQIDIIGVSIGRDHVPPIDANGVMVANPGSWTAVVFSREGEPDGYAVRSYFLEESVGIDEGDVGAVVATIPEGAIRHANNEDIDALDVWLSDLYTQEKAVGEEAAPVMSTFYFTISATSITSEIHPWFGTHPISAATIFKVEWNGTSWSSPTVYKSRIDLGYTQETSVEIDGLAIDDTNDRIVVSLVVQQNSTPERAEEELMFLTGAPTNPHLVAVMRTDMTSVGSVLAPPNGGTGGGGTSAGVDAISFFDPDIPPGPTAYYLCANALFSREASPFQPAYPGGSQFRMSLFRRGSTTQSGTFNEIVVQASRASAGASGTLFVSAWFESVDQWYDFAPIAVATNQETIEFPISGIPSLGYPVFVGPTVSMDFVMLFLPSGQSPLDAPLPMRIWY
ncbi:MAG: hypothetical protein IPM29_21970 [Planctomycetes bacterium]|nr:hypothetical protein [Planctomycetota bacterium]